MLCGPILSCAQGSGLLVLDPRRLWVSHSPHFDCPSKWSLSALTLPSRDHRYQQMICTRGRQSSNCTTVQVPHPPGVPGRRVQWVSKTSSRLQSYCTWETTTSGSLGKTHPATRRQPRQRGTLRCGLRVHGSWGRWLTPSSIGSRGRGKPFDLEMGQLILPGTERVPPSTRSGLHPCPTFDWVTGWPRGSSGEKGP